MIEPHSSSFTASQQQMKDSQLPLGYRDQCSALLIPLNKCRRTNWYLPWHCEHQRHEYEHCQYLESKELSKKYKDMAEE
ncbi:hypothetical protein Clacol_002040 [Clathrus columnatus]|uniref:NADH dehydrogenase [ubiquinone] 1 beta subcomplex subunit 7 n=1 Tax=Clathrus columnatus TaxID=1419009 RepID=A0AAV5A496_9AGAM|nr:hypothetical protein Clacol_002040 [Clathrus columnatus]